MAHDVFISYSTDDQKIVEGLSVYLEQNGIRCFVAYRDIPRGFVWAKAITKAIEDCKLMIVVFSEHFNRSEQVDREIEMCMEDGKPILTFRIQDTAFTGAKKYYLKNINWIDAFPDPEESFGKLADSAKKLLPERMPEEHFPVEKQSVTKPTSGCLLKIRPNITCEVWVDGEKNTLANANQITKIPLNKGTFWLEFISAENEQDKYACEYTVANPEELLAVDLESIAKERMEKIRKEKEKIEKDRLERERIEKERLEKEKIAYLEKLELVEYEENGKFGYKISGTNKVAIQAKYDATYGFKEGLAYVKLNGKYGFIDKTGKEIIPLKVFAEGIKQKLN